MQNYFSRKRDSPSGGVWAREPHDSPTQRDSEDDENRPLARPPNEHTRLLPNRLDSEVSFLSPDDPAVSPYNLWAVRIVHWITIVLTALTFLWWVLLLVLAFATPPGLHTRGSGFTAFGHTSFALAILLITLLFFVAPSRAARVLCVTAAVLLFVNLIIMVAVPHIRHEETWTGIASATWAMLVALWALAVDRTVAWGKTEEEERLTGRPETRRTLLEWIEVLLNTIGLGILALAVLLMTLALVLRALDAKLAPPGKMYGVDSNKYEVHVYCHGNETDATGRTATTVLLEGGENPVENGLWQLAQHAVDDGSISRYCFADRPGIAWSDAAPSPFSASMASDALSEALVRAGEHGPWVLASAGVGSLYSRVFSSRHGGAVRALLLIDPLHEDLLDERVGGSGRGFLLWLRGILSPLGLDRLSGALFRGRNSADRVWGVAARQNGKALMAALQENLVAGSLTRRDVTSSRAIQDEHTPLVVVSSGVEVRRDSKWEDAQRDLTHVTQNLKHWDVVPDAPHRVWDTSEGREVLEKRLRKLVRL